MKILLKLCAAFSDDHPPIIDGDKLTVRGHTYDFSPLQEGAEINVGSPFIGNVTRLAGHIECQVEYRYSIETAEPLQLYDESRCLFTINSGQCQCPIQRKTEPVEAANE